VVKAAENGLWCDGTETLNRAMERGVLVQRSMGPRLIIVGSVRTYDSAQVRLTEYDHVVQAFSADRANEPLNVSVLPGWSERNRSIPNTVCTENLIRLYVPTP